MKLLTDLMPHQERAVDKLIRPRVGAAFMDMGTGKTRVAIELVKRRHDLGRVNRVVWFCPVSLRETIRQEIFKHTEGATVNIFNDKTTDANLPACFWHVIGIESMSQSDRLKMAAAALITRDTFVVLDESTYIKGHRSARTCWITDISSKCRYRMILTGTPLTQGVVDLFAQIRFLSPDILGYRSFYSFARNHLEYSERFPGMIVAAHNTAWLAAKLQPYTYQVTKDECLELPEKLHETIWLRMTDEQQSLYEKAKWQLFDEMLDFNLDSTSSLPIFRLFTALQQITCGYWREIIKGESTHVQLHEVNHDRIDALANEIDRIPEDAKVIIWAKDRYSIAAIVRQLGERHCAQFHGGIPDRQRSEQIALWKQDKRYFVATPSSAGHGLTLNESHYVIFYNNGFKYSERLQAEDRNHRIGQSKKVTYITLACSDSLDERIEENLAKKGNVLESFRDEINQVRDRSGKINKKQLKELFKRL